MSIWEWLFVGTGMGLLAFLAVSTVVLIYALERVKDVGVALCERADAWAEMQEARPSIDDDPLGYDPLGYEFPEERGSLSLLGKEGE